MTLVTSGRLTLVPTYTKTPIDLVTGGLSVAPQVAEDLSFATGTTTGLADKVFFDTRTVALSTSENLDLAGVLTDVYGDALTFVKVKLIYVKAAAANTNDVVLGNGTNPFIGPFGTAGASLVNVPPGGIFLARHPTTGWAVTPTTGDILKVLNGGAGTSVTYDIIIIGTSA